MRLQLKLFRISKQMKQSEFADKLGVNRSGYSMIEQGKRDGTMAFWNKLQKTFNIPEDKMYPLMKKEEE